MSILLAAILFAATPAPASGVQGVIVLWPTCPVERIGHPCEKPVAATVDIETSAGHVLMHCKSDASGKFRIALAPGSYVLRPEPLRPGSGLPRPVPQPVVVLKGLFTTVRLVYDTGIR